MEVEIKIKTFAEDVLEGLTSTPKYLSSKYFYDEKGDALFQQIMGLEEYYLTNCEFEVFSTRKEQLLSWFLKNTQHFNLIEFGAGDGTKTKVLLDYFLSQDTQFRYMPIDISANVLEILAADLHKQFPNLDVKTLNDDYFEALHSLNLMNHTQKVVLFLGANIGNFSREEAKKFMQHLAEEMSPNDLLLTGFDLKKDPDIILAAYDDAKGVTRDFNLNLLHRINKELGANFDVDAFKHQPLYDPITGETKSYLVSKREQNVHIAALDRTITFNAWEAIFMEVSQKYNVEWIEELAKESGFVVCEHFYDHRNYFVDSLWRRR